MPYLSIKRVVVSRFGPLMYPKRCTKWCAQKNAPAPAPSVLLSNSRGQILLGSPRCRSPANSPEENPLPRCSPSSAPLLDRRLSLLSSHPHRFGVSIRDPQRRSSSPGPDFLPLLGRESQLECHHDAPSRHEGQNVPAVRRIGHRRGTRVGRGRQSIVVVIEQVVEAEPDL